MEDAHQLGLQMGNYKVYRLLSREESLGKHKTFHTVPVFNFCLFGKFYILRFYACTYFRKKKTATENKESVQMVEANENETNWWH